MLYVLFFLSDVETNTGDKVIMSFIEIYIISSRINIVNIEREEDLRGTSLGGEGQRW